MGIGVSAKRTSTQLVGGCWITTYAVVLHVITLDPIGMFTVLRYSPLDFFIEMNIQRMNK